MLSVDEINELEAKNKELEDIINKQTAQYNSLLKKYNEVLQLAKENADSNEYCIQELEKENEKLKEVLFLSVLSEKDKPL